MAQMKERAQKAQEITQASPATFQVMLTKMEAQFAVALGSEDMAKRFTRVALTEARKNPKLFSCTDASMAGSLMMAAQLRLDFTLGTAYLIPYRNNRTGSYEAQFQIGYMGLMELFYRHPLAKGIDARAVYEKDELIVSYGTDKFLKHVQAKGDRGDVIGYYSVVYLRNGYHNFVYQSHEDIIRHRNKYAQGYDNKSSAWSTDFDAMALKTVIKQVLKYMPRSIEMAQAFEYDGAIKRPLAGKEIVIDEIPSVYPEVEYQVDMEANAPASAESKEAGSDDPFGV